ncbi:hypothetical protein [Dyadobacter frigoris]|uniref:Uncharacterized protein n=1 Tax=Dyadobacter frigoris TaxID=2576211 RepID=A0A4U6D517_9BACT|nr:hypothetical protein [Dyadobacter frigoris]TKT91281.1 hypothetical protein FDK13_16720 [Dyadobacter frigoris]GLU56287.1 hypothetical protein Dfri01_57480 [Dyadobacter frigoris]
MEESIIRIRASDLEEVIQILRIYQSEIITNYPRKRALTRVKAHELINRYLNKCLEIETLAIQFDCSVTEIKQLFLEENIVIAGNKIPKEKPAKIFWRRKKRRSGLPEKCW